MNRNGSYIGPYTKNVSPKFNPAVHEYQSKSHQPVKHRCSDYGQKRLKKVDLGSILSAREGNDYA